MTLDEAGKNYGIALYYDDGWSWAVECGYQNFDGHNCFDNVDDCYNELIKFLETFEGPTK